MYVGYPASAGRTAYGHGQFTASQTRHVGNPIKEPSMRQIILLTSLLLFLPACTVEHETGAALNHLEYIQSIGKLRVLSRSSPASVFSGGNGLSGLEYELASGFTQQLGVELELILAVQTSDIVPMVRQGRADLAATGLATSEWHKENMLLGPAYYEVSQQLIYRRGNFRPSNLNELDPELELAVVAGSSHHLLLEQLSSEYPELVWSAYPVRTQQELLQMVADGDIGYTIANSNEIGYARRYYPMVAVAFELTSSVPVTWMFRNQPDTSLYDAAVEFFSLLRDSGELALLYERYFGHVQLYDYVDARSFLQRIPERLPGLQPHFKAAAIETNFDWRLLAALSYQESHWDPEARSPTGVRGLMMLTQDTAESVGVDDRTDPVQSIHGGARYLREVLERIPGRILEPDRTWLALAAYNIGFGHLEDARRLTQMQGGNPDLWQDVRQRLPLLSEEEWYTQTTYGYARGGEPVAFVQNIRRYYDVLQWSDRQTTAHANNLYPAIPQIVSPAL